MDLAGNEFPFSRGVSFYEVNDDGKITSARDCVEPALKPGASALQVRIALRPPSLWIPLQYICSMLRAMLALPLTPPLCSGRRKVYCHRCSLAFSPQAMPAMVEGDVREGFREGGVGEGTRVSLRDQVLAVRWMLMECLKRSSMP